MRVSARRFMFLVPIVLLLVTLAFPSPAFAPGPPPPDLSDSVLYLWAGDKGTGVTSPLAPSKEFDQPDNNDFLSVVDADPSSATYGQVMKVVEVPTAGPGNEPHHMQPFIPPGCTTVFAGSLFADFWHNFHFNPADPSDITLFDSITPAESQGTVPDAAFVMPNCEALGTEMGGDPSTGSYVGGPHGTVIRMNAAGDAVLEAQLSDRVPLDVLCAEQWNPSGPAGKPGGPFTRKTSVGDCLPSNPHGIWGRPDLAELVTSDYATPGRLIQAEAPTADVAKLTVRHYALNPACTGATPSPAGADCIGDPRVVLLPDGPRNEANEGHKENVGVMETATTNSEIASLNPAGLSGMDVVTPDGGGPAKGAFATTMCGGALYYTADMTAADPVWREVYDFTAANQVLNPGSLSTAGCVGGGGVTVSADNKSVVHSIIGRDPGQAGAFATSSTNPNGFPGMLVKLDVEDLIEAGTSYACNIDTVAEVWSGGAESDCPTTAAVHEVADASSGGPHFFSFDYPNWDNPGGQDDQKRLAYFNYFVSETGSGGDLRVCMLDFDSFTLDSNFPAAVDGQNPGSGCISFNRSDWPAPRGAGAGPAKPHYGLFNDLP